MDKRKLIGTIIGVTLFAILIVGATFAWLTFSINVDENSTTTGSSMNFSVTYLRGNDIESMQILATATPATVTSITSINANKVAGSAPGTLYLYLNTNETESDDVLSTSGAINYAVCIGTCTTFDTAASTGTITSESQKILYEGELPAEVTTYNIYFWLDGNSITNAHLRIPDDTVDGGYRTARYSGYISAEAKQVGYE